LSCQRAACPTALAVFMLQRMTLQMDMRALGITWGDGTVDNMKVRADGRLVCFDFGNSDLARELPEAAAAGRRPGDKGLGQLNPDKAPPVYDADGNSLWTPEWPSICTTPWTSSASSSSGFQHSWRDRYGRSAPTALPVCLFVTHSVPVGWPP
jgi:hypothetical protein